MTYRVPHWSERPLPIDDRQNGRAATASDAAKPITPTTASGIDPGKLHTTVEAADILRLADRTLERMRVQGDGPPFVKLGNGSRARVVYRGTDLIAWIESQIRNSTSDRGR